MKSLDTDMPGAAARAVSEPTDAVGSQSPAPVLGSLGLVTVLMGAALPLVDTFIVNVALPSMGRDLGAGQSALELVVAGYGVAYAVLLVLGGRLGDNLGRRRLFMLGMVGFGLTSLGCGLAPDAWTLVGARVAQGATAALMLPQVLATIHAATSGPRKAKALSLYGSTAGLSMVVGQILGGVLVDANLWGTGWRAVFFVNLPVVVCGLALATRSVPETRSPRPVAIDVPGTVLLAAALAALLLPLTEGRAAGWPWWTFASLALFPFVAGTLYLFEQRAERLEQAAVDALEADDAPALRGAHRRPMRAPLVPPSLLRLVGMRRGLVLLAFAAAGFGGFMFILAVALQLGLRFSPIKSGLALAPMAVAFFFTSLRGPKLVRKYGSRILLAGGLLQAVGLGAVVVAVWAGWSGLSVWDLVPGLVLAGAGQGLQLPLFFRIVLADVPADRAGVGSGVMVTIHQSSTAIGVAGLGTLFLSLAGSNGMRDALALTLLVQVGMVLVTCVLSLRVPRTVA